MLCGATSGRFPKSIHYLSSGVIDATGARIGNYPIGCHFSLIIRCSFSPELWLCRTCLLTSREQFLLPDWNAGTIKVEQKHRASERVAAPKHPTKKVKDLSSMSIDELWALHETVAATLVAKMTAEKEVIEDRLRLLNQVLSDAIGNNRVG
jgi:hypothetical protein